MLKDFDVVRGTPVDYMHAVLHGVVGLLSDLWFDSKNKNENFYIGQEHHIKNIDENIKMIRPPKCFTRKPRSINDRSFYKASEQLNFLLHYGAACLDGILSYRYIKHFQLLSSAIFTLTRDSFSRIELEEAKKKLQLFETQFPKLYGKEHQVYNEHLVSRHIVDSVEDCGPLWGYSNFPFEDFNGVLKKYVNGTTDVIKQIVSKYILANKIREKFPVFTKKAKLVEKVGSATLFGRGKLLCKETKSVKRDIRSVVSKSEIKNVRTYKTCCRNSIFIKSFHAKGQCDDSVFKTEDDDYFRVYHILKIRSEIFLF